LQGLPVAEALARVQGQELNIVRLPYLVIGLVLLVMILIFAVSKMPKSAPHDLEVHVWQTAKRLFRNKRYLEGVVAQGFYVGAQIMCWTFIIHYAKFNLGWEASKAQRYNIIAMIIFCSSRFICTYLLKFFSPGRLLMSLAIGGIVTTLGAIFVQGIVGLYSLIAISACMSLMFPTIYGIALDGLGQDAKLGSAGLIFAIVGGALMPPLQGRIIDLGGESGMLLGFPAVSASFVLPLICFLIIALYGYRSYRFHHSVVH